MAYFLLPQRLNKNSKQLAGSLESILLFRQEEKEGRQRERGRVRQRQTGNSCLCLWLVRLFASPCSVSAISSLSLTIFSFLSTLWSLLSTFACQAQEQDGTGRDSTGQRQPAYWDHMF